MKKYNKAAGLKTCASASKQEYAVLSATGLKPSAEICRPFRTEEKERNFEKKEYFCRRNKIYLLNKNSPALSQYNAGEIFVVSGLGHTDDAD